MDEVQVLQDVGLLMDEVQVLQDIYTLLSDLSLKIDNLVPILDWLKFLAGLLIGIGLGWGLVSWMKD